MVIKRWEIEKYFEMISRLQQSYPEVKILLFEGIQEEEKINKALLPAGIILSKINDDIISSSNVFISAPPPMKRLGRKRDSTATSPRSRMTPMRDAGGHPT
jgi:hypothetical protein